MNTIQTIYPTSESIPGPWLLDSDALRGLDELVDSEWKRLTALQEEMIKAEVEEKVLQRFAQLRDDAAEKKVEEYRAEQDKYLRGYSYRNERVINVTLRSRKTLRAQSFADAMRQPDVVNETVEEFDLQMTNGKVSANVSLSTKWYNGLQIRVTPSDLRESAEFFTAVRQWARNYEPSGWLRWWQKANGLQWGVLPIIFMFYLLSILAATNVNVAKSVLREEGRQLLSKGLTSADSQRRAIEIILALESEYVPKGVRAAGVPIWCYMHVGTGLAACIALSFAPHSVVGIGRGAFSLSRWRRWLRVVSITIPGLIATNFVLPPIVAIIKRAFWGT